MPKNYSGDNSIIEEIEKEVRILFGNNDINMPIVLIPPSPHSIKTKVNSIPFIELVDNIKKRKIEIKRKNDSINT